MFACAERDRVGDGNLSEGHRTPHFDNEFTTMKTQVIHLSRTFERFGQDIVIMKRDLQMQLHQQVTAIADLQLRLQHQAEVAASLLASQKQMQVQQSRLHDAHFDKVADNFQGNQIQNGMGAFGMDGHRTINQQSPVAPIVKAEQVDQHLRIEKERCDWQKTFDSQLVPLDGRVQKLTEEFAFHNAHVQEFMTRMEGNADQMKARVESSIAEMKTCIKDVESMKFKNSMPNDPVVGEPTIGKPLQMDIIHNSQELEAATGYKNGSTTERTGEIELAESEFTFSESLWDASLFIGTTAFGVLGSLQICFLMLANALVQLIYAYIVSKQFTQTEFSDDTIEELHKFRVNTAQAYRNVDQNMYRSLATRVCQEDETLEIAGYQVEKLSAIRDYLPQDSDDIFGEARGQVMCTLSVLVWTLVVVKEVKAIAYQLLAIGKHACDNGLEWQKAELSQLVFTDGAWKTDRFCLFRVLLSALLAAFRLFIAVFLYVAGLQYLVHTIDLRDLVLNAVALECVLLLDELVFEALAPAVVSSVMGNITPLMMPKTIAFHGLDAVAVILLAVVAGLLGIAMPVLLSWEVGQLKKASDVLCSGRLDFVYSRSKMAPFFVYGSTNDGNAGSLTFDFAIAEGIINGSDSLYVNMNMQQFFGSTWSLESLASWGVPEAQYKLNNLCMDFLMDGDLDEVSKQQQWLYRQQAAQFMGTPVRLCSDIVEWCDWDTVFGQITRILCPRSCGCHRPDSKFVMSSPNGGCAPQCYTNPEYMAVLADVPCEDWTFAALQNDAVWIYTLNQMVTIAEKSPYPPAPQQETKSMRTLLLQTGCPGVALLRTQGNNLCDESPWRAWPFRSLRRFCPRTCGCTSYMLNCPGTCNATANVTS